MNYNKIAIVGPRGSGKTTISDQLSKDLSLPVFHMDEIMWSANWEAVSKDEYIKIHDELINKDKWIIDGSVDEDMKNRLSSADLVIYIDYPVVISTYRFMRRYLSRCINLLLNNGKKIPEEPFITCIKKMFNQLLYKYENRNILSLIERSNIKRLVKLKYFKKTSFNSESLSINHV